MSCSPQVPLFSVQHVLGCQESCGTCCPRMMPPPETVLAKDCMPERANWTWAQFVRFVVHLPSVQSIAHPKHLRLLAHPHPWSIALLMSGLGVQCNAE